MSRIILRRALAAWMVSSLAAMLLCCTAAASQVKERVAWKISAVAQPTNLPLTHHNNGEPTDQYTLVLTNIGSLSSNGAITLADQLPEGVTVGGTISTESGWECSTGEGARAISCTYNGTVQPLGQSPVLTIPVAVTMSGLLTNRVIVSGGGAPAAAAGLSTQEGMPLSFEFLDFSSQAANVFGEPDVQASDHPYALTTSFDFPQREGETGPEKAFALPKMIEVDLPTGLVGNPQATSHCAIVELSNHHSCRPSSRVGTIFYNLGQGFFTNSLFPIYNMVPERGYPAEFGFYIEGLEKWVLMYASVGPPPDFRLHLIVPDIPTAGEAANAIVTFFGEPTIMDGEGDSTPFFTNSGNCSSTPLSTDIKAYTWEEPSRAVEPEGKSGEEARVYPVAHCDILEFQPSLSFRPENFQADEPSGYTLDLNVPQAPSVAEALSTPDVKSTTVTLPLGLSLSPAAADGLRACPAEGSEGMNLASTERGHCPLASEVGVVEATTPLLAEPLQGQLYVAQPGCGGVGQAECGATDASDGNLFQLYLQLEGSGVVIKLHGTASANSTTGQLTASFRETPQQPFSDLKVTLKSGPRAPLANPQSCGDALTMADVTPWSTPETPDATPSFVYSVTGCEGNPFVPSFLAGTTSTNAGAYTSFSATFSRTDRMQDLGAIQVQTPPGLLGSISHITLCEEPQAAAHACPADSRIGTATASAGAGSHPFWVSGSVYLTGPYKGAPFGLLVALPAVAGPFNLGTVVVRSALNVDPATSALTITSDPLPQVLDGVPLRVQTVNVTVDRPQFMFNPTNCEGKQITARIASAQGAVAQVSSPFAAGGCKNLPFNPGFKAATRAPGSKKKGTSFDVKVSSAPGQANIRSVSVKLPKQLPARLTTIQQACPEATFTANPATCPVGSLVGIATGITPVLPVPITGPAYLVSHGGAAFPDLDLVLQGEGVRVDLTGSINIAHGVTSSTFASIPDVPITSFDLRLPEGRYSALTVNGNICAKPLIMPTTIVGQNGRRLVRTTKIAIAGCPKATKKRAKKKPAKTRRARTTGKRHLRTAAGRREK